MPAAGTLITVVVCRCLFPDKPWARHSKSRNTVPTSDCHVCFPLSLTRLFFTFPVTSLFHFFCHVSFPLSLSRLLFTVSVTSPFRFLCHVSFPQSLSRLLCTASVTSPFYCLCHDSFPPFLSRLLSASSANDEQINI